MINENGEKVTEGLCLSAKELWLPVDNVLGDIWESSITPIT